MKVSVIIRAYNEEEYIERLFLGISEQVCKPHEIILVDSGSTDQTVKIALRHGAKVVTIPKHEFTFGGALNVGCQAATGDICVFPSAHVYPIYDTWLSKLIEPFRDERVVLAYGRQRGNSVNKFSEHQIFTRWFPAQSVCPQKTYFCNNANCAIRRSVWSALPYDESLTGLEDLAWAKAAQAKGGWIAYTAEAEIVHVHDETWQQVQNRYLREALAMRCIDDHAKFTGMDLMTLMFRNVFSDTVAGIRKGVLAQEFVSIVLFRFHQLLGTYRGFNGPPEISAQMRERLYYPGGRHEHRETNQKHASRKIDYAALETQVRHSDPDDFSVATKSTEANRAFPGSKVVKLNR